MAEVFCGDKGACLCTYISAEEAKVVWCREDISVNQLPDIFTNTNINFQEYAAKRTSIVDLLETTYSAAGEMFSQATTQPSLLEPSTPSPTATLTFDVMGIKMTLTLATATVALIIFIILLMLAFIIRKVVSYILHV